MGEEHCVGETRLAMLGDGVNGDARKRLQACQRGGVEGERHQAGPRLDQLQAKLGGPKFEVVAINIDTRDPEKPKDFLKDGGLTNLSYFYDNSAKVFQDLKAAGRALGMPTSMLVDGSGCEIATIAGPAEWASDDAVKLVKAATDQ